MVQKFCGRGEIFRRIDRFILPDIPAYQRLIQSAGHYSKATLIPLLGV